MLLQIFSFIRNRWHPLSRLRGSHLFRRFQSACDVTVFRWIPEAEIKVAVKLLRDASWIINPGALEPEVRGAFALVLDLVKPAVVWDVGANIGFYSWFARRHPAVREVVMFEPDPTNFALITETIRRNRIEHCEALNVALGDRTGEAAFLVDRASGAIGSLEANSDLENKSSLQHAYGLDEVIRCRTARADDLVADGVPAPDLIKIDVEGAENEVLAGANACLERERPVLIVETLDPEFLRRFADLSYDVFRIDSCNFLAIPRGTAIDRGPIERRFLRHQFR